LARFGLYGDVWLRGLTLGIRITPWFLEPLLVAFYSLLFYGIAAPARAALLANLRVLHPTAGLIQRHIRAWQVLWNFAWSLVDAARARDGQQVLDWEIHGLAHLDQLASHAGGAIVLTAHMGSYDLAAPLFASRLRRRLHLVRAPERQAQSQAYASQHRDHLDTDWCVTHYNEPGNLLAVTLASLLKEGQLVALQGDRILFDVAAIHLPFNSDQEWRLPKGPFLLGMVARAPLFPIFITRTGWRRYAVTALAPWFWPEGRFDKTGVQEEAAKWWSQRLAEVVRTQSSQWFVFEPVFRPLRAPVAAAEVAEPRPQPHPCPVAPCVTHLGRLLSWLRGAVALPGQQAYPNGSADLFLPSAGRQSPLEATLVSGLGGLASWVATALLLQDHALPQGTRLAVAGLVALPVWLALLHGAVLAPALLARLIWRRPLRPEIQARFTSGCLQAGLLAAGVALTDSPLPLARVLGWLGIVLIVAEAVLRLLRWAIQLARPAG
jgi:lauroyl/myristoyl acyltransferase